MDTLRDPRSAVLFLGSGASALRASGLPLFRQFLGVIADVLDDVIADVLDEGTEARIAHLSPESLFRIVRFAYDDAVDPLVDALNAAPGRPNPLHAVAAALAIAGAQVWTTNYDTLIEEAVPTGSAPLTTACRGFRGAAQLVKPHGSLQRGPDGRWVADPDCPLVFTSDQVAVDLSGTDWGEGLVAACEGKDLWIVGYSGQDVDLYLPMRDAIAAARSVRWYERWASEASRLVRWRYDDVLDPPTKAVLDRDKEEAASRCVRDLTAEFGWCLPTVELPQEQELETPSSFRLHLVSDPLSLARLADRLGEEAIRNRLARKAVLGMAVGGASPRHRYLGWALATLLKAAVKALPFFRFVRAWVDAIGARLPRESDQADKARYRYASRPKGRLEGGEASRLEQWRRCASNEHRRLRLQAASLSVYRNSGDFDRAASEGQACFEAARRRAREGEVDVEVLARVSFELAEIHRMRGSFSMAADVLRLRLTSVEATRWQAWSTFEEGSLHLMTGDLTEAYRGLAAAAAYFKSIPPTSHAEVITRESGEVFTDLNTALLDVAEGRPDRAEEAAARLSALRHVRRSAIHTANVAFLRAELARARGHPREARQLYRDSSSPYELHQPRALLGEILCLAALGHDAGEPALESELTRAAHAFQRRGSPLGGAYCLAAANALGGDLVLTGEWSESVTAVLTDWEQRRRDAEMWASLDRFPLLLL